MTGPSAETIARLRAKTLTLPVPEPTAEDRASYVAQLRSLGGDDALLQRLGLLPRSVRRRWWPRRR